MAAGDFTASVSNRAIIQLNQMFNTPNHTQVETLEPAMSAKALLSRHRARTSPMLVNGKCVGVKAWYQRGAHNPITEAPTTCATPSGVFHETLSQNYDNEMLAGDSQKVRTERCNNELDFATEYAYAMRVAIASCRKQLNNKVIARVLAQAQTNFATLPDSWTASGAEIQVPKEQFVWDNLGEFEYVASNNLLGGQYFALTGRNFYNEFKLATAYGNSPEGQARMMMFGDYPMYFDARYLDSETAKQATFFIEENAYAFWNYFSGSSVPEEVSVGSNGRKFRFFYPDPELMYNDGGVMRPVTYQIETEVACATRNANLEIQADHTIFVHLVGGFKFSPNGVDSEANVTKGVLQFVAV